MEITQEHKTQAEEISSSMEYSKDFVCYESGFEDLSKIQIFRDGDLVECLEDRSQLCKFSFHFGYGFFVNALFGDLLLRTLTSEFLYLPRLSI